MEEAPDKGILEKIKRRKKGLSLLYHRQQTKTLST
jgi:hypothetical protein